MLREKYSAGATSCPSANAQAHFTTECAAASSRVVIGATSVAIS